MQRRALLASPLLAPALLPAQAAAQAASLVSEEFLVPARDPGIEIFVRNKRPEAMTSFAPARTLLFVHGATYPAHTAFDLPLGGLSWMDYMAARGFDVWLLDLPLRILSFLVLGGVLLVLGYFYNRYAERLRQWL